MQIKTEQIDEYPAAPADKAASLAGELDVAKEVLVAQAGKLKVYEQYALDLQASNDKLMAFVGELASQLSVVAREHEARAAELKAAIAARDKAGSRRPDIRSCAEARAATEASLTRSLQSVEIDHAKRMKAAEEGHAESLKAVTDRLKAAEERHARQMEERHARQMEAAEAKHAESLEAVTDRLRTAEQAHADKLKGVEHAYAYNIKAVTHINAERLEALEKAHAEKILALEKTHASQLEAAAEQQRSIDRAHAVRVKSLVDKLCAVEAGKAREMKAAEDAHAQSLKDLRDRLVRAEEALAKSTATLADKHSVAEEAHAETLQAPTDKTKSAETRGAEPRPHPRPRPCEQEDIIDALSKTFEFAPPFSPLDECRESGFLVKPIVIKNALVDLQTQGQLPGLTKTGLLVQLGQRGYPKTFKKVHFDAGAGKQYTAWIVGVKIRDAPVMDQDSETPGAKKRQRLGERERQAESLGACDEANAEILRARDEAHAESLRTREQAQAEILKARDDAHAESLRAREQAHAESLRAREQAHADTEAVLTEKLRSAEEAVMAKDKVLKRLFHASRGLLEVHLGTRMRPEGVAFCMAMTEPSKDRKGEKRKRLEFSKPENCIEWRAPKLIEATPNIHTGQDCKEKGNCNAIVLYRVGKGQIS
jgi:hypothetical protein